MAQPSLRWDLSPRTTSTRVTIPERVVSTGPLAIDPVVQEFVGVLVENNRSRPIVVGIRLFNKDVTPKALVVDVAVPIDPGGTVGIAFPNPGFFYEAQVALPRARDVLVAIYGLTGAFQPVAANTLRSGELITLFVRRFVRRAARLPKPGF